MMILHVAGATRVLGKSQGYAGLPVRDEQFEMDFGNGDVRSCARMVTAWEPTPDELARLNAGAPVILKLLGTAHPPVQLDVGEPA